MFEGFNWFIILYTVQNNQNNLEHMVGFPEPPTIHDTKGVLDEVLSEGLVPTDQPVYMCQMPADQAKLIFLGDNHGS